MIAPQSQQKLKYSQKLKVRFMVKATLARNKVSVTLFAPPFNTHSFSMNQRLLVLDEVNPSKMLLFQHTKLKWQYQIHQFFNLHVIIYYLWSIKKFRVKVFGSNYFHIFVFSYLN